MTTYLLRKNNLNDSRFLIRNHGGQKEVAKYFFSTEKTKTTLQGKAIKEHNIQLTLKFICDVDQNTLRSAQIRQSQCLPQTLHHKTSFLQTLFKRCFPNLREMNY